MPNSNAHDAFVAFMQEYTAFLGRMRRDESIKLSALASKELRKIEHSISVSQANAKQLENFEAQRIALQASAGYEGMSFRQVITNAPKEKQSELWDIFTAFESHVAEIRFYNDKSMAVARDNMLDLDPEAVLPGSADGAKPNNPYEKIREEQNVQGSNILERKA